MGQHRLGGGAVRLGAGMGLGIALIAGVGLWYSGSSQGADAARVKALAHVSPEEAAGREGQDVVVRGTAGTDAPLAVAGVATELLYVRHKRTQRVRDRSSQTGRTRSRTTTVRKEWVEAFRLGSLTVRPKGAQPVKPTHVKSSGNDSWEGIRANAPRERRGHRRRARRRRTDHPRRAVHRQPAPARHPGQQSRQHRWDLPDHRHGADRRRRRRPGRAGRLACATQGCCIVTAARSRRRVTTPEKS
jgi:hypothetical protein